MALVVVREDEGSELLPNFKREPRACRPESSRGAEPALRADPAAERGAGLGRDGLGRARLELAGPVEDEAEGIA